MPSVKNPNGPSKNRIAASAAKKKKTQRQKSRAGQTRISKSESARGARPGILPTSGPGAALSSKKKRKIERAMSHALRRKMEATREAEGEGEVVMKDLPAEKASTSTKTTTTGTDIQDEEMQIE